MAEGGALDGEEEEPETSTLRDNFVLSGDQVNFDYLPGIFDFPEPPISVAVVSLTLVDGKILVALPDAAWNRVKAKRQIPVDTLQKAVRVLVQSCSVDDPETPSGEPQLKVWLGILAEHYEDLALFGPEVEDREPQLSFPREDSGQLVLPYAQEFGERRSGSFHFSLSRKRRTWDSSCRRRGRSSLQKLGRMCASHPEKAGPWSSTQSTCSPSPKCSERESQGCSGTSSRTGRVVSAASSSSWSFARGGRRDVPIPCSPTWRSPYLTIADDYFAASQGRKLRRRGGRGGRSRRCWIGRSCWRCRDPADKDSVHHAEGKGGEEEPHLRRHPRLVRRWWGKRIEPQHQVAIGCSSSVEENAVYRSSGHLPKPREAPPRRLGRHRRASWSDSRQSHCTRLVGASKSSPELSDFSEICLGAGRSVGLPPLRADRRSQSESSSGCGSNRPTVMRQRELPHRLRDHARRGASFPQLQLPPSSRRVGDAVQSSHRSRWMDCILAKLKDHADFHEKKQKLQPGRRSEESANAPGPSAPKIAAAPKRKGKGKGEGKGEEKTSPTGANPTSS